MNLIYRGKILWWEIKTILSVKKYTGIVEGNLAMCSDGNFIIMIDYDNAPIQRIEYELKSIQKKYRINTFYIIQSSPNKYHAVSFEKVEWNELREILEMTCCDTCYRQSRTILLRTSPKNNKSIQLYKVLKQGALIRQKSKAHALHYTRKISELKEHINFNELGWDENKELMLVEYTT